MGRSVSTALAPPAPSAPPPHFMGRSCPATSSITWGGVFLLLWPLRRLRRHLPISSGGVVPPRHLLHGEELSNGGRRTSVSGRRNRRPTGLPLAGGRTSSSGVVGLLPPGSRTRKSPGPSLPSRTPAPASASSFGLRPGGPAPS